MKRILELCLFGVLSFGLFATASCHSTGDRADVKVLCDDCGQIKGADACCAAGATVCSKCDLAKGSPGCCKIEKGGGDVTLCTDCGRIEGSSSCCDENAPRCASCDMIKGSPGCCK